MFLESEGRVWRQKCSKLVVAGLRCGHCEVVWWSGDGFDARESVSDKRRWWAYGPWIWWSDALPAYAGNVSRLLIQPVVSDRMRCILLGSVQFPREEGEGLPSVTDTLLQHGTHGGSGGVRDECKWRRWVGGVPVVWCATNWPCMHRRPWGFPVSRWWEENPWLWGLGSSSVGQKLPIKVQHVQETTELTGGFRWGTVLQMCDSFFKRSGTLGGHLVTEEGYLGCPKDAFCRVNYDPVCLKTAEENS
jgi:hypothetical protein